MARIIDGFPFRAVFHGLILAGILFALYLFLYITPKIGGFGYDAFAYWNVDVPDAYVIPVGHVGSFNYTPPIALVMSTFGLVDWWVFLFLWTALLVATVVWIGGSPVWILAAFAIPFVALELYHGNIHLLLAAALVLSFRHPWTWSFVLLTKPTSGVALLWYVVRREWRPLAIALGATVLLALVALLVMPSLWFDWFDYVTGYEEISVGRSNIAIPLWLRLVAAAAIVIWGAWTDRRWTVIVSATLALPVLWIAGLAMLIGVIPEIRDSTTARRLGLSGERGGGAAIGAAEHAG